MHQRRRRIEERGEETSSKCSDRSLDRKLARECRNNNYMTKNRGGQIMIFLLFTIIILSISIFYLYELFLIPNQIINRSKKESTENNNESENQCSVYLAPSSVPGGGMGMFTVKHVKKGGIIFNADGPSIPIIDPDNSKRSTTTWVNLFSGYWWGRGNGLSEPAVFEANDTAEYQITCGALPNSHPFLNNLDVGNAAMIPYDDSWMDRTKDPGAGANSYYMGRTSIAKIDIEAGEEIFLSYPSDYMNYLSSKYNIPQRKHYKEAGEVTSTLLKRWGPDVHQWKDKELFLKSSKSAQSLLPKTNEELERVLSSARNPRDHRDMSIAIAKSLSVNKRTVDWIRDNGICLDNIVPGMSFNPRAGKGAIASRFMKKGDVIAPAPLLQITDRDALRMPAFHGEIWQLLLNYCLGRYDTSLLLCPDTNAILVNHCSERRPDIHPCGNANSKPNAKYRWAKWDEKTDAWLNMTIEEMEEIGGRGLSLEIVATSDIQEGEEVFVDYGISWEEAWDDHIENWKPRRYKDDEDWKPAKILNDELGTLPIAPTLNEKYITTDNRGLLFTGCYYYEDDEEFWERFENQDHSWSETEKEETITRFGRDYGEEYAVDENKTYAADGDFWPCVVVHKEDSRDDVKEDTYTVRIIQSKFHKETVWSQMELPRLITNYPRSSIRHLYLPYKSDLHLPGVFRHFMELPDDLFQPIWKNR